MATEPEVMQPMTQSADPGLPAVSQAAPGAKVVEDGPIQEQLVAWSNEFGTDPLTILKENNITNSSDIYPGQMLTIPSGGAAADTSEEDTLLSSLTDMVSSSWDDITGGDSADPVTGGEAEILGEEPGAVPDQNAALDDNTGEPAEDSGSVLETIQNYVIAYLDSKGFPMDASTGNNIDTLVKESTPFVEGAIEEAILIGKATLPIRIGEESKYTMGGGPGGAEETINEFVEEIGEKIIVGTKAVINPEEGDESSFVNRFINAETEKAPEVIPTEDLTKSEPAIAEGTSAAIVPASKTTTETVINKPPPQDELLRLQALYKPLSTGEVYFNKVIEGLKAVPMPTEFDAAATYKQLAEDAVRDTKKIDDRIAEIAEEKIKPTFKGFDKFLAVLGASLGAYASAMTGTPNFALNIINKAIDADQEQFLASKDIRTKSLLDQRQAVLQRRSDLLQLAINQADRMLKAAETQRGNVLDVASLEGTKLALENAAKESHNAQITMLIENQVAKITLKNTQDLAQTKEQRELGVKAITLKDADGKLNEFAAYYASSPKEGAEHRESWAQTYAISKILDDINEIAGTAGAFMPDSLSNTKTSLANKSSQLIVHLKELYGMGANFTVFEQALVRQQTPTDGLLEQFKVWKQKSKDLRRQLIMKHEARSGSQGGQLGKMPNAANQKKKAKGQTTIYKAP